MNAQKKCLYEFGSFQLDPAEHTLLHDGKIVSLTPKVFDTLLILVENNGHLVEKDELLEKVWADTIVEEANLAKNISILRKVLSQNGLEEPFIETVPKHGYRFVALVKEIDGRKSQLTDKKNKLFQQSKTKISIILAVLFISIFAVGYYFFSNKEKIPVLTDKDVILLIDFENKTGEEIFDGTLKRGLTIALKQSPFLSIFHDAKAHKTLKLMKRDPKEPITREFGREICQRNGLKAYIVGTISKLGDLYIISLDAVNALTGEKIALAQASAESQNEVLDALSEVATKMREKLGEPLSQIEKFEKPLPKITTSSLEALKAFSTDWKERKERVALLKRAIELDPNFAMAYIQLSNQYSVTQKFELRDKMINKAFELRHRVSERERLIIESYYYWHLHEDFHKTIELDKLGIKLFPREAAGRKIDMGWSYIVAGQHEKAIVELKESLRLDPNMEGSYGNLAFALLNLNRFEESKKYIFLLKQRGFQRVSGVNTHLYHIAKIEGDFPEAQKQLDWLAKNDKEAVRIQLLYETAAFKGRWNESETLFKKLQTFRDKAGTEGPVRHAERAAYLGNCEKALKLTKNAIKENNFGFKGLAVKVLAMCGDSAKAKPYVEEWKIEYPRSTLRNGLSIPIIEAWIELIKRNPEKSIDLLERTRPYERSLMARFRPQYLRGQAYLQLGEKDKAVVEFQNILDHRGEAPLSVLYPLAQLGKARAIKDKLEYEKFFEMWKYADEDLPILIEAKKEYEKLK